MMTQNGTLWIGKSVFSSVGCNVGCDRAPHPIENGELRVGQRPSFAFSKSLTACGLALPPDDFIT